MPSYPDSLPPAAVRVLDRLPDPPERFTEADVTGALAEAGRRPGEGATAADVLDALLAHELASRAGDLGGVPAYVVHPEARPF